MALKYRQVRRFVLAVSFLAVTFVIYLATFSTSYPCQELAGKGCNERLHSTKQKPSLVDRTANEVHMLIKEGQIVKRSNSDEDSKHVETRKTTGTSNSLQGTSLSKKNAANERPISKLNRSPFKGKITPTTKKLVTLSNEIRNYPVHSMYIQIKEADSPKIGDFPCAATAVPECCAFSVSDTNEAKRICEAFGKFCKGFVMSTISSKKDSFEYIMYLKKDLNGTLANYLTDFFIKVDFLDELKWNEKR